MRTSLTALVCLLMYSAFAQLEKPTSLAAAIDFFETEQQIRFSYDPEIVELIDSPMPAGLSFEAFQQRVEALFPLKILPVGENYYTISLTEATYTMRVTDASDSEPLPETNVLVNGRPVPAQKTGGKWSFSYTPSISDTVSVFSPGYETTRLPFALLLNKKDILVSIDLSVMQLSGLIIKDYLTKGISFNPSSQSIAIDVEDLPLLPGETDGDLFASLAALPGIATPDNRPGNLFIRGSSTDQSFFLFDDVPIYHRGHYFGTISPYNSKVVEEVKVYRNGFHPRLGGRVGGAVEISSPEEPANELQAGFGSNTLNAMAYLKAPMANNKLGLSAGARRSYPFSFYSPKLKSISEMVFAASGVVDPEGNISDVENVLFEDYHLKAAFRPNRKNLLSISTIYTQSEIAYKNGARGNPAEQSTNNTGINFKWRYSLHKNIHLTTSLTNSNYATKFSSYAPMAQTGELDNLSLNEINDLNILEELSVDLKNGNRLQLGADLKKQQVSYDYRGLTFPDSVVVNWQNEANALSASPFFNYEINSLSKFYFQLGLRTTYYNLLNQFNIAPRLFANYYATDRFTIKGSAGRYFQYLNQIKNLEFSSGGFDNELWYLANGEEAWIIKGDQVMLGSVYSAKGWVVDMEGYYKTTRDVSYFTFRRYRPQDEFVQASHVMYGIDLFVKRKTGENGSLWAGYSWGMSKLMFDSARDVSYDSKFSQPHMFNVGGAYEMGRWKVSAGWKLASGLNARSFDMIRAEMNYLNTIANRRPPAGDGPPPSPPANPFLGPDRYPYVHMLDVSASWQLPATENRRWSSTIGLSLINLYNQKNLTDKALRAGRPAPTLLDRYAMQFAPNLMVIVEW